MAHPVFHIGTLLLLISAVLLLVSTISAPVVNDISLLRVNLGNNSHINFGALGFCVLDVGGSGNDNNIFNNGNDYCSSHQIGYDISNLVGQATGKTYNNTAVNVLTRSLVLHPIATGLAFLAFLIALTSHCIGFLFASFIAAIAWVITLVAMAIDFSIFGVVKNHVNGSGTGATAEYREAIWLTLAAFVLLFFASITTCFACFTDRRRSKSATY